VADLCGRCSVLAAQSGGAGAVMARVMVAAMSSRVSAGWVRHSHQIVPSGARLAVRGGLVGNAQFAVDVVKGLVDVQHIESNAQPATGEDAASQADEG